MTPGFHQSPRKLCLFVSAFLFVSLVLPSAWTDDYLLKVVYIVPSNRSPYPDYGDRLDYILSKIQSFCARHLEAGGVVDSASRGKRFQMETDGTGKLVVHLIDHSPGGNYPDAGRIVEKYRSGEVNLWEDVSEYLPSGFGDRSAVIYLVDQAAIQDNHALSDAPQGGAGTSGPGQGGYVVGTDHFLGNAYTYSMTDPPLIFNAVGRNDAEQLAIFRDTRFTNIFMGPARVYQRESPPSWNPGEASSNDNLRVWEYASIVIGALAHELGHAFALKHVLLPTEGATPGTWYDLNVMGRGFCCIYQGLFPEETFTVAQLYPRLTSFSDPAFGSATILHPVQFPNLNRNQFFNAGALLNDYGRPAVQDLDVTYNPDAKAVQISVTAQEAGGSGASGLSHITYALDWNARLVVEATGALVYEPLTQHVVLGLHPSESAPYLFPRGIHSVLAEAMDLEGNTPEFSTSLFYFGIGDDYVQDWLIWSEYFDTIALLGHSTPFLEKLAHAYFPTPDAQLIPMWDVPAQGRHSWRYRHTNAYLSVTDKLEEYFVDPPPWSEQHLFYAAARLISNRERSANLRMGYNDLIHVFLNGEEVFIDTSTDYHDAFNSAYVVTVPVTLQCGENLLVVKNFNDFFEGGFWVCLREESGVSVKIEPYPPEDPDTLGVVVRQPTLARHWWAYR